MITREQWRDIKALIRPVKNRVDNMVARGVVTLVNSAVKMQLIQVGVQEGETKDDVEHFQPFGFNSVPLKGAESILMFVGGDRNAPVAVVTDDRRHRPTGWADGEAGTFNAFSAKMHHKADGTTEVTGGGSAALLALKSDVQAIKDAISGAAVAANDGGALFKTNILAALTTIPAGTTKLKGE